MSLLELLQSLGGRLGILEHQDAVPAQRHTKIRMRSVTLAELVSEIRSEEVRTLAEGPAELDVPFEKICETAGIPDQAGGWHLAKMRQLLLTPEIMGMDRETAQRRIQGILSSGGGNAESLVREAIARDRALDSFQDFARRKLEDRMAVRERRAAEVRDKMRGLQAELDQMQQINDRESARWQEWLKKKRAEEKDLAWLVGYLIDRPVITVDEE